MVSLMDLKTGEWTEGFKLTFKLMHINLIAISTSEVFICRGSQSGAAYNKKSWIYNIETGDIERKATATSIAWGSNCALLYLQKKAKKVVFCSATRGPRSNRAEIYDIQENKWELQPEFDMPNRIELAFSYTFGNRF